MSEWVSVHDRLPERKTPVLIYAATYSGSNIICVAELYSWDTDPTKMAWESIGAEGGDCWDTFPDDGVTYWMPLPEPPK